MKKIVIYLLLGLVIAACDKDDDNTPTRSAVKNQFRVKEIKGSNEHWGDYTMTVSYYAEELDSILVYNTRDTLAYFSKEEKEESVIYSIYDIVPNISKDSIRVLEEKYGAAAKDSIPMVEKKLFSSEIVYENQRIWQQTITSYVQYDDMSEGAKYLTKDRTKYIYEYNPNGFLSICRMFIDTFDTTDPDDNREIKERAVRKLDFAYDGEKTNNMVEYRAEDEYGSSASYVKVADWNFVYSGNNLTAVNDIAYQYNGNLVTGITREGAVTRYAYNADGYVTRIDYANGDYLEIKYEAGHGNFSIFAPILEQSFNIPYIR